LRERINYICYNDAEEELKKAYLEIEGNIEEEV